MGCNALIKPCTERGLGRGTLFFGGGSLVLVLRAMRSLSDGVEEAAGSKGFLLSGSGSGSGYKGASQLILFQSMAASSSSSLVSGMRGVSSVVGSVGS